LSKITIKHIDYTTKWAIIILKVFIIIYNFKAILVEHWGLISNYESYSTYKINIESGLSPWMSFRKITSERHRPDAFRRSHVRTRVRDGRPLAVTRRSTLGDGYSAWRSGSGRSLRPAVRVADCLVDGVAEHWAEWPSAPRPPSRVTVR
jgi:hypothetical protein